MEGIYILGNSSSLENLDGIFINIHKLHTDVEIHNWVIDLFSNNSIEKIVIEIGDNPILSLRISYHIRLSISELKDKVLIPILFVSNKSLYSIILETGVYSQILTTESVYFAEFNLDVINEEIEHISYLNSRDYLSKFLRIINIQPNEKLGRHSLANIWGAYILGKVAKLNSITFNSEFKSNLYFKYISAFNNLDNLNPTTLRFTGKYFFNSPDKINAAGKKILLIDDEADKGWETVLRRIFKTTNDEDFVVISEKIENYSALSDVNKQLIENFHFDLYLIDLRLNGIDEDENINTEEFSGMTVLKKIKTLNKGNQVIVFTASNKAWNLKTLLEKGADGYYIKESPEYNFPSYISERNYHDFKLTCEKSFKKNYLSEIFDQWRLTKETKTNYNSIFIEESNKSLDIAWELIVNEHLELAYFTIFQIIETYAEKLFVKDDRSNTYEVNSEIVIESLYDKTSEWLLKFNNDALNGDYFTIEKDIKDRQIKPTSLYKISCMLYILYKKDNQYLKRFGKLNKLRNNIAHNKKINVNKNHVIDILNILKDLRI